MPALPSFTSADSFSERESLPKSGSDSAWASTPRLLCVCEREPSWVSLTMSLSSAGIGPPRLNWVSTSREALGRARDEPFDCVLVDVPAIGLAVQADTGPFALIRALRTGGFEDPVIIVGRLLADAEWLEASQSDCDVFVSPRGWESAALGGIVKRALRRGEMLRESRRLLTADHRRLLRERDESEQLLAQQRQIIAELETLSNSACDESDPVSLENRSTTPRTATPIDAMIQAEFSEHYAGLLRSYVLMGSGSLAAEIAQMAGRFVDAGVSPPDALQLHLECVERLVKGLGNRSSRHVVARADLLAVEMMTHLAQHSQRVAQALGGRRPPTSSPASWRNVSGASGIDLTGQGPNR